MQSLCLAKSASLSNRTIYRPRNRTIAIVFLQTKRAKEQTLLFNKITLYYYYFFLFRRTFKRYSLFDFRTVCISNCSNNINNWNNI